ncbi:hypothetical protein BHM03_00005062 [Ensete ventricosum]|nr:hypothetical protein BHM03_00005062 [Ensete ventricosum]
MTREQLTLSGTDAYDKERSVISRDVDERKLAAWIARRSWIYYAKVEDAWDSAASPSFLFMRLTRIKGHPRATLRGGITSIPKEIKKTSASEKVTSNYILRGNANLTIEGISSGTHYPDEGLSLHEQPDEIGRKTCIKATT